MPLTLGQVVIAGLAVLTTLTIAWPGRWFASSSSERGRAATGPRLERLRLNGEGKPQVDVVLQSAFDHSPSEVVVRFHSSQGVETIRLAGWTATPRRRIATASRPLPCGRTEQVVATLRIDAAGPLSLSDSLNRSCDAAPF